MVPNTGLVLAKGRGERERERERREVALITGGRGI